VDHGIDAVELAVEFRRILREERMPACDAAISCSAPYPTTLNVAIQGRVRLKSREDSLRVS
jgi:hypothetical protein